MIVVSLPWGQREVPSQKVDPLIHQTHKAHPFRQSMGGEAGEAIPGTRKVLILSLPLTPARTFPYPQVLPAPETKESNKLTPS